MHPSPSQGLYPQTQMRFPYPSSKNASPAGGLPISRKGSSQTRSTYPREDMLGGPSRGPQWLRRQPWARAPGGRCSGAPRSHCPSPGQRTPRGPTSLGDSVRWKPSQVQATDSSRCSSGSTVARRSWTGGGVLLICPESQGRPQARLPGSRSPSAPFPVKSLPTSHPHVIRNGAESF